MQLDYGEIIKLARKSRRLTQSDLAEKSKIAINSLRRYESGERVPTLDALEKISISLGVRTEDLIGLRTFENGEAFDKAWKEITQRYKENGAEAIEIRYRPNKKKEMDSVMNQLNGEGQRVAVERVKELTEMEKYKLKESAEPEDND